jgi:hypothetical protein
MEAAERDARRLFDSEGAIRDAESGFQARFLNTGACPWPHKVGREVNVT